MITVSRMVCWCLKAHFTRTGYVAVTHAKLVDDIIYVKIQKKINTPQPHLSGDILDLCSLSSQLLGYGTEY